MEYRSNPGILIMLENKSINTFKKSLTNFLPWYVNHKVLLSNDYHYKFGILAYFLLWDVEWTNITTKGA